MSKFQVPTIGGIRKVIHGPSTGVGTTIAEVGSGTISLEQLAAAILNILTNTQSIVTGQQSAGVLVPGPGLSGGGVLVGNVPIRLTAPIPWFDSDGGGGDGDPGPPGQPGVAGIAGTPGVQGPGGALVMFGIPDDGADGDVFLVPGPIGATGATGTTGASGTGSGGGASLYIPYSMEDGSVDNDMQMPTRTLSVLGPHSVQGQFVVQGALSTTTLNASSVIVSANALIVSNTGNNGGVILFPAGSPSIVASGASSILDYSAGNSHQWYIGGSQVLGATLAGGGTAALTILQAPGNSPGLAVIGSTLHGTSQGLTIRAGATTADFNFKMTNTANSFLMELYGDGSLTLGASTVPQMGLGTIDVSSGYFINGIPISQAIVGQPHPAFMLADDTSNDDGGALPDSHLPASARFTQLQINGAFSTLPNVYSLLVTAPGNNYAALFQGSITSGLSLGPLIQAGTTSTDSCFAAVNASGTTTFFNINGDGHGSLATNMTWTTQGSFTFGSATGSDGANAAQVNVNNATLGLFINAGTTDGHFPLEINNAGNTVGLAYITGVGRMNLTGSLGIKGATPAVTAAQTDIGVTTTVTVITTAGGIALPALASTFWVVNVNGVKYGVPCFAL